MANNNVAIVSFMNHLDIVQYGKLQYKNLPGAKNIKEFKLPKRVSWLWGGKRYYGTLIRETKTHKFARTENGKIKKIKKK